MLNLDRDGVDRLLNSLEKNSFIDPQYSFCRDGKKLVLLGWGGSSYVYEMFNTNHPDRRYAAKIIGVKGKDADAESVKETTKIQYNLSEQSENIMRVILIWTMKLLLDENGSVTGIVWDTQKEYDETEAPQIQIILTEKLERIISHDKYGNTELLREELRTQDGVEEFARQIGSALCLVHDKGYLHRDIKLENIFWDSSTGKYKLGDFGIARFVGDGDAETVVFTDGYGAPEIERRLSESYNVTADVYSFGVTLYLLLNDLKFPASDRYHVNAIMQYSKDFIFPAPDNASEDMAAIVRKMCSYRSGSRYQSVDEVLADIAALGKKRTEQCSEETDDDFATELHDDEETVYKTEYNDDNDYVDKDVNSDDTAETPETPLWKKPFESMTREERKTIDKITDKMFMRSGVWRMVLVAVLCFALYKFYIRSNINATDWHIYVLPALLLIEAVMQEKRTFHAIFGAAVCAFSIYSMYLCGIGLIQAAVIFAVIVGIPAFSAGCAVGSALYIAQVYTRKFAWLDFLHNADIGWLVIIGIYALLMSLYFLNFHFEKLGDRRLGVIGKILGWANVPTFVAGVVLFILMNFTSLEFSEAARHLHLIWVSVGMLAVQGIFRFLYFGEDNTESGDEADEFVDD